MTRPLLALAAASSVFVGGLTVVAMAASPQGGPAPAEPARTDTVSPEDEAGAALLVRLCNRCHDGARIVDHRRTRADWQNVLLQMIAKGAEGEEQEFETVFAYLCRNHGQVRINDAPADEIAAVLALTRAEADAIVGHRTSRGPFADFAALSAVPGVDAKKLEKKREALVF